MTLNNGQIKIDLRRIYEFRYFKDQKIYKTTWSKYDNFNGDINADFIEMYLEGKKIFTF